MSQEIEPINCILHGNTLDRLEKALEKIHGGIEVLQTQAIETSTQLKFMNGSVTRATEKLKEHEAWLKTLQSAYDTLKGVSTGALKWGTLIVLLTGALASAVTFILTNTIAK